MSRNSSSKIEDLVVNLMMVATAIIVIGALVAVMVLVAWMVVALSVELVDAWASLQASLQAGLGG